MLQLGSARTRRWPADERVRRLGFVLVPIFMLVGACAGIAQRARPASLTADEIRERSFRGFSSAVFYKPRESSMDGEEMTYAPLIVQEIDETWDAHEEFGTVGRARRAGKCTVDPHVPTVYVTTSSVRLNGRDHDQVVYLWVYGSKDTATGEIRGVRITLSLAGSPLVWEVLSTGKDRSVLFVSKSLEDAARREFGEPLPTRRFSVERGRDEADSAVLVRIVEDGPVPMGPYVYLEAPPRREVTTVLCRCMPSQVESFAESRYYDLVPLEMVESLGWVGAGMTAATELHRLLRWPKVEP